MELPYRLRFRVEFSDGKRAIQSKWSDSVGACESAGLNRENIKLVIVEGTRANQMAVDVLGVIPGSKYCATKWLMATTQKTQVTSKGITQSVGARGVVCGLIVVCSDAEHVYTISGEYFTRPKSYTDEIMHYGRNA